ncbi:hypothetical protein KM043_004073 [Ampulex compressa]|nr:hypothetical protein KM043_004073 [Ampulex compressa]
MEENVAVRATRGGTTEANVLFEGAGPLARTYTPARTAHADTRPTVLYVSFLHGNFGSSRTSKPDARTRYLLSTEEPTRRAASRLSPDDDAFFLEHTPPGKTRGKSTTGA